ncbi:hypothetical protein HPB49_017516 [Dermacentor silvarum]|uniref:Uncharacterized protein n=1 Tax=Dermacentor silvarum TaxID=543639 RepID=A0ACB8D760_DERSI|nr:hypothetical protein HPB49_017516 [Dermacentor silvarum]
MSFINWRVATAEDLSTLNAELIKTKLQRRSLFTTDNKEELIDRHLGDTAKDPPPNHEPSTCVPTISTSFPTMPEPTMSFLAMPTFTSDPAENMQPMAAFLHRNVAIMMTTIASHASPVHKSWSAFNDLHDGKTQLSSPSRKESDVESQQTGMPQQGDSLPHGQSGRPDFKNNLWQQKVTALTQKAGESLQQYTFAKLKIKSHCPVSMTGKERIEYLMQGIRGDQVATSIDVQRPRTVDDFLSIPTAEPLQFEYEPDDIEALLSQFSKAALVQLETTCPTSPLQTSSSSPLPSDPLTNVPDNPLTDICLGAQLNLEEQVAVKRIVQRHAGLFSTSPEYIGLNEGVKHEIKLVPEAKPYGRQPYRYTASDRQFFERQTATLLESDSI